MILSFDNFLNEISEPTTFHRPISSALRKSLDKLDVFDSIEDIVRAIEQFGLNVISKTGRENTCDFAFIDSDGKEYRSFTTGDIRVYSSAGSHSDRQNKTRIVRSKMEVKDRLLFILRRAAKKNMGEVEFTKFLNNNGNIKQFLHDNRGKFASRKFAF